MRGTLSANHVRPTLMALRAPHRTESPADRFERLVNHGHRVDLIQGTTVRLSPAGAEHGHLGFVLAGRLAAYLARHQIGRAFGAETGFRLADDTVLAPDLAFVRNERLPRASSGRGSCAWRPTWPSRSSPRPIALGTSRTR